MQPVAEVAEFMDTTAPGTPLPLMYGAMFAFLSQLSSIGKGMQKVGVQNLPELSLRWVVIRQYAMSRTWSVAPGARFHPPSRPTESRRQRSDLCASSC